MTTLLVGFDNGMDAHKDRHIVGSMIHDDGEITSLVRPVLDACSAFLLSSDPKDAEERKCAFCHPCRNRGARAVPLDALDVSAPVRYYSLEVALYRS